MLIEDQDGSLLRIDELAEATRVRGCPRYVAIPHMLQVAISVLVEYHRVRLAPFLEFLVLQICPLALCPLAPRALLVEIDLRRHQRITLLGQTHAGRGVLLAKLKLSRSFAILRHAVNGQFYGLCE